MANKNSIKFLNYNEKPREKLLSNLTLTNEELLAILIRSGGKDNSAIEISREIFRKYKTFKNISTLDIHQILQIKNIGIAKATSIKAACEIALRINDNSDNITKITTPKDIYDFLYKELFGKQKEYLYLINLDSKNKIISKEIITIGTTNQALISSKDVFKKALEKNATAIILVHNHPSNDPTPSKEDLLSTQMIAEAGKKIGIPLIDHIIFSDDKYISLKALNVFSTYKF